jgi:tetratricopeptide (TPR) repeat protein
LSGTDQKLLAKNYTENNEAYRLYLRGRHHLDKRTRADAEKSNEYFQQAVSLDPDYALAYAGLADSYFALGTVGRRPPKEMMAKAKSAAARALRLDENLAEGHASFGWLLMFYDYDWVGAERELKRAIELNPNSAIPHQYYATCLASLGRFDEALSESKLAIELDPLSLFINRSAGTVLYYARQYDRAIEQFEKTAELDPNFAQVYGWLVEVYEAKGLYDKAVEADLTERDIRGGRIEQAIPSLKKAYSSFGWRGYWQKALEKEMVEANPDYDPYSFAVMYARLGQQKLALQWLERAYDERICLMISIKVNPEFDVLRSDPRFRELERRVGLTQ